MNGWMLRRGHQLTSHSPCPCHHGDGDGTRLYRDLNVNVINIYINVKIPQVQTSKKYGNFEIDKRKKKLKFC